MIKLLPQQQNNLTPLFDLCKQVIPYLDGKFQTTNRYTEQSLSSNSSTKEWLFGDEQDGLIIQALIDDLHKIYPDAGKTYYMTRTWELVCWQPMYISFIAIYGLKQLPDFSHFKQKHHHDSIYGFIFESEQLTTASVEKLISLATKQLQNLFEHYRLHLDSLIRCRPGYTNRLTADLILSILIKISDFVPDFSHQDVLHHAQLWLKEMALPLHLANTLVINDKLITTHARTSCCLTYKANNDTCINCPKKHRLQPTRKSNNEN